MQRISIGKIVGITVVCIIVGWLLSVFGITPDSFWRSVVHLAQSIATGIVNLLESSWGYLLAGAAVVLPIYIGVLIYRRAKRR